MNAEGNAGPWKGEAPRVLIVDDEKDFVLSLEDILESRGYWLENEKKHLESPTPADSKAEAIATLAGSIAHEFNNALSIIAGNAGLLELELPNDEKIKTTQRR